MQNRLVAYLKSKMLKRAQKGTVAVEYGLLAALVSVMIIGSVQLLGNQLSLTFNRISEAIADANANAN